MTNEQKTKRIAQAFRSRFGLSAPDVEAWLLPLLNELQPEESWKNAPDSQDWWWNDDGVIYPAWVYLVGDELYIRHWRAGPPYPVSMARGKWRRLHLSAPEPKLPDVPTRFTATHKEFGNVAGQYEPQQKCCFSFLTPWRSLVHREARDVNELTDIKFLDTDEPCDP